MPTADGVLTVMPRIFACLAIGHLAVLFGTAALGLMKNGDNPIPRHVALAVFALLVSCFIQVAAFTSLTVSGKLISQAVHLGRLDGDAITAIRRIKRSWTVLLAMVLGAIVLVVATGATMWRSGRGAGLHFPVACVTLVVHLYAYSRGYGLLVRAAGLVKRTLRSYERDRAPPAER